MWEGHKLSIHTFKIFLFRIRFVEAVDYCFLSVLENRLSLSLQISPLPLFSLFFFLFFDSSNKNVLYIFILSNTCLNPSLKFPSHFALLHEGQGVVYSFPRTSFLLYTLPLSARCWDNSPVPWDSWEYNTPLILAHPLPWTCDLESQLNSTLCGCLSNLIFLRDLHFHPPSGSRQSRQNFHIHHRFF